MPVPGGPPHPPSPVLQVLGAVIGALLTMRRMLEEFVSLGAATGWKLKTAKPGVPSAFVFVPV